MEPCALSTMLANEISPNKRISSKKLNDRKEIYQGNFLPKKHCSIKAKASFITSIIVTVVVVVI